MSDKRISFVDEWFIIDSPYPREEGKQLLCGTVKGDPRANPSTGSFTDGHHIVSSVIVDAKIRQVETKNTLYTLGDELKEPNEYWTRKLANIGAVWKKK